VTTLFEAVLEAAGITLEQSIVERGSRGCAIGVPAGGGRALVTVVGPNVPADAMRVHPGWDLGVGSIDLVETLNGPRTILLESLPVGIPSVAAEGPARPAGVRAEGGAPAYVVAAAGRVVQAHERGETVGWLHPALVFMDPRSGALVAIAQRPLRVGAAAPGGEGDPPLFGLAYSAPSDVRNRPSTVADDIHRLAALVWRWRHGVPPFDGLSELAHLQRLAGVPTGAGDPPVAASIDAASDPLDLALARALRPDARDRPSAAHIVSLIRSAGPDW